MFVVMCRVDRLDDLQAAKETLLYWLRFICSCRRSGGGSSVANVVLVANACKGIRIDAVKEWLRTAREDLAHRFGDHVKIYKECFAIDCISSSSVAALRSPLTVITDSYISII